MLYISESQGDGSTPLSDFAIPLVTALRWTSGITATSLHQKVVPLYRELRALGRVGLGAELRDERVKVLVGVTPAVPEKPVVGLVSTGS